MLQLFEANLPKLLAYAIAGLVALLMGLHVLGSVDWLGLLPEWILPDFIDVPTTPTQEGCVVMPDGLLVCEPNTLRGSTR